MELNSVRVSGIPGGRWPRMYMIRGIIGNQSYSVRELRSNRLRDEAVASGQLRYVKLILSHATEDA